MLILPIKRKWYDMILSGEKKEEYRELKPYYQKRFEHLWQGSLIGFDAKRKVMFRNGYSKLSPSFIATVTLDIGTGKTEWGAEEEKNYYILKICDIEPQAESNIEIRKEWPHKPCINYEDGCEEWAGCPCVYYKGRK